MLTDRLDVIAQTLRADLEKYWRDNPKPHEADMSAFHADKDAAERKFDDELQTLADDMRVVRVDDLSPLRFQLQELEDRVERVLAAEDRAYSRAEHRIQLLQMAVSLATTTQATDIVATASALESYVYARD